MIVYFFAGIKTPIVSCKDIVSTAIGDKSSCSGVAPNPGNLECNMGECPLTYAFKLVYTKCSVTCGNGKLSYASL